MCAAWLQRPATPLPRVCTPRAPHLPKGTIQCPEQAAQEQQNHCVRQPRGAQHHASEHTAAKGNEQEEAAARWVERDVPFAPHGLHPWVSVVGLVWSLGPATRLVGTRHQQCPRKRSCSPVQAHRHGQAHTDLSPMAPPTLSSAPRRYHTGLAAGEYAYRRHRLAVQALRAQPHTQARRGHAAGFDVSRTVPHSLSGQGDSRCAQARSPRVGARSKTHCGWRCAPTRCDITVHVCPPDSVRVPSAHHEVANSNTCRTAAPIYFWCFLKFKVFVVGGYQQLTTEVPHGNVLTNTTAALEQ